SRFTLAQFPRETRNRLSRPLASDRRRMGVRVLMTWEALTGNPRDIQAPRTPTSQRMADDERIRKERQKRPRKPSASMKCISVLYDPFDDLDFALDYDIDKSFDENIRAKYGHPPFLD